MVLELVDAQPLRRMIERIDGAPGADRAEGADLGPGDEAVLVHPEILAGDDVGPDLRVLVEEKRSTDGGLDHPRAGIEAHDSVEVDGLAAGVLKRVDKRIGIFHSIPCSKL